MQRDGALSLRSQVNSPSVNLRKLHSYSSALSLAWPVSPLRREAANECPVRKPPSAPTSHQERSRVSTAVLSNMLCSCWNIRWAISYTTHEHFGSKNWFVVVIEEELTHFLSGHFMRSRLLWLELEENTLIIFLMLLLLLLQMLQLWIWWT